MSRELIIYIKRLHENVSYASNDFPNLLADMSLLYILPNCKDCQYLVDKLDEISACPPKTKYYNEHFGDVYHLCPLVEKEEVPAMCAVLTANHCADLASFIELNSVRYVCSISDGFLLDSTINGLEVTLNSIVGSTKLQEIWNDGDMINQCKTFCMLNMGQGFNDFVDEEEIPIFTRKMVTRRSDVFDYLDDDTLKKKVGEDKIVANQPVDFFNPSHHNGAKYAMFVGISKIHDGPSLSREYRDKLMKNVINLAVHDVQCFLREVKRG